jgi:hypothetical protein
VAECKAGLIPTNSLHDSFACQRGKQKKQRLLAYLREHPEELRPVSRKLRGYSTARVDEKSSNKREEKTVE